MFFSIKFIIVLLWAIVACSTAASLNSADYTVTSNAAKQRVRRQFDLTVAAEHDDKDDETELALEAIAGLWRSRDGLTQVDGTAKVVHRSNSLQQGNTRYSATLHLHRDYKRYNSVD